MRLNKSSKSLRRITRPWKSTTMTARSFQTTHAHEMHPRSCVISAISAHTTCCESADRSKMFTRRNCHLYSDPLRMRHYQCRWQRPHRRHVVSLRMLPHQSSGFCPVRCWWRLRWPRFCFSSCSRSPTRSRCSSISRWRPRLRAPATRSTGSPDRQSWTLCANSLKSPSSSRSSPI